MHWMRAFAFLALFCAVLPGGPGHARGVAPSAKAEGSKILHFVLSIDSPRVGDSPILFVQAESGFTRDEIVLSGTVDGVYLPLNRTAQKLWVANLGLLSEVKSHLVQVNISLRNEQEATRLQAAITANDQEIAQLSQALAGEPDPAKQAALQAQIDAKSAFKTKLENDLADLAVFLRSETYHFTVAGNPEDPAFPWITGLSPNIGLQAGGSIVTINGTSFGADPTVTIGGVEATVVSASGTAIQVVVPALPSVGPKDVVVLFSAAMLGR